MPNNKDPIIEDNYDFKKGNHLPYYYLGNTDSQQQLSQDILIEAEQEVAKPYAHKLLESENLSKNEHIGDHNELLFNHGFIMFPLDKLAKLSPSLAKDLKKFFD